MRIALFITCIGDVMYPDAGKATVEVGAPRRAARRRGVGAVFPHRVTYHPTCHSLRVIRVGDAPLRLLQSVRDLELVELPREQECCGFGGTFSLKNEETSSAMLADKCRAIEDTGADYCTALDGSCLLQIGGGLSRRGSRARPIHLAEIFASA
jgi:L-lactate dehydrogenase complex protein LldE